MSFVLLTPISYERCLSGVELEDLLVLSTLTDKGGVVFSGSVCKAFELLEVSTFVFVLLFGSNFIVSVVVLQIITFF